MLIVETMLMIRHGFLCINMVGSRIYKIVEEYKSIDTNFYLIFDFFICIHSECSFTEYYVNFKKFVPL